MKIHQPSLKALLLATVVLMSAPANVFANDNRPVMHPKAMQGHVASVSNVTLPANPKQRGSIPVTQTHYVMTDGSHWYSVGSGPNKAWGKLK